MKGLNSALKRKSHQNETDQPTTPQRHTHSSLGHDVSTKLKSQKKMEKKNVVLRKWRVLSFDSFIIIPLPALSPLALHLSLQSTKRRHFTHPVPFSFLISFLFLSKVIIFSPKISQNSVFSNPISNRLFSPQQVCTWNISEYYPPKRCRQLWYRIR